jgi:CRP/FNR family transcriptional regulator, nitrogen fixation regulation protein
MLPLPRTQTTAGYRTERRNAPAATVGSPLNPIELMGAQMPFSRDAEIFGEKEPAEYIYKVVSGAVRTYRILADGRRQIQAFHLAGDVFGFEPGEEHTLSAEAIVDSRILVIKRTAVEALAARDNQVARGLLALMARELQRVQRHVTLLVMTAQERVIDFLLEMTACDPEKALTLPMSRQDIADYLGLTIETVSRTFSSLETAAAIELPNSRRVVLRDREALSRLAN